MKHSIPLPVLRRFFCALTMAFVLFASAACTGLPQSRKELGPFVLNRTAESIPAFENKKKPRADLHFSLLDVTGPGALQTLVRQLLYDGQPSDEYLRLITRDWQKNYTETAAENPLYSGDWDYTEDQELVLAGSYAVITRHISTYTGGAHPNRTTEYFVISLETSRRLRLSGIITGTTAGLTTLVDRELRRFSEAETGESLPPEKSLSAGIFFEDAVPLSEDFYPGKEGLTFCWDPYEIAPYAAGEVEILITWQELDAFLSPEGKKLAAAFTAAPPAR
jgi:hypothetical protein